MAFCWGLFIGAVCGVCLTLCIVGSIYWRNDIDDYTYWREE